MESNYKMYISSMKSTILSIDPSISDLTITGWMKDISDEFPYYRHTNPNVMAISMYIAQKYPGMFNRKEAMNLVLRTSFNYTGKKNTADVVVDVARYWKRLTNTQRSMPSQI